MAQEQVNVRYMVSDVQASVDWYTTHLGFRADIATPRLPLPM